MTEPVPRFARTRRRRALAALAVAFFGAMLGAAIALALTPCDCTMTTEER